MKTWGSAVCLLVLLAPKLCFAQDNARAAESDPAQSIREWLAHGASQDFKAIAPLQELRDDPKADPWFRYLAILGLEGVQEREEALRKLLSEKIPDSLRRVILLDIQSETAFQSRQAQFIRRYGFYANWFNRLAFVA